MSGRTVRSGVLAVVVGAILSGCVVADPGAAVVAAPPPPPPVQTEVIPVAPGPAYGWVPGHWGWRARGYTWVPGYYAVPAQPGWVWVPGHWAARRGGWVWVAGRWRPRR